MIGDELQPRPTGRVPRYVLSAAGRGLLAGLLALGTTVLVGYGLALSHRDAPYPCDADSSCDGFSFSGIAVMILLMPVTLGLAGPLAALLLKLPTPSAFVLPACWAGVVLCASLDTPAALAALAVLPALYVLVAIAVSHRRTSRL
ncbi:hypothetical protein ACFQY4_17505 [Catellatospora bangladeshensis]|uniref:Uncharacterized protein n=1 Tax=Catellatospora bangladeshensis TaxID=310355 RepID=A0A8J3JPN8_9ACTN|nr:hypothetical protein [Catellatospora bangladeshensis]GIF86264.1 hypothetical protein Cba03nite_76130 [Catellatospora bangladeshensis]